MYTPDILVDLIINIITNEINRSLDHLTDFSHFDNHFRSYSNFYDKAPDFSDNYFAFFGNSFADDSYTVVPDSCCYLYFFDS